MPRMSQSPVCRELRQTAIDLARLGAATALRHFGNATFVRKDDQTPVTAADHAAQEAILDELARRYPSHSILVEEEVAHPQRHAPIRQSEYCWVVDPLDGTRNFARGVRVFATSVAVMFAGRPVVGAIYDATSGTVYSASVDEGAFRDEASLRLAPWPADADTTIAISSFRRRPIPRAVRDWMDRYLFRNHGSIALHLAWVAAGLVDAAYALECKLWDVAAGALIIEHAGGVVTDHEGRSLWPMNLASYGGEDVATLAGTRTMHGHLLTTLRQPGT